MQGRFQTHLYTWKSLKGIIKKNREELKSLWNEKAIKARSHHKADAFP